MMSTYLNVQSVPFVIPSLLVTVSFLFVSMKQILVLGSGLICQVCNARLGKLLITTSLVLG